MSAFVVVRDLAAGIHRRSTTNKWYQSCERGHVVSAFPPKWVLMIMTYTIKELMRLLSYEQDLKSLNLKRASIDAKSAKGTVHELH